MAGRRIGAFFGIALQLCSAHPLEKASPACPDEHQIRRYVAQQDPHASETVADRLVPRVQDVIDLTPRLWNANSDRVAWYTAETSIDGTNFNLLLDTASPKAWVFSDQIDTTLYPGRNMYPDEADTCFSIPASYGTAATGPVTLMAALHQGDFSIGFESIPGFAFYTAGSFTSSDNMAVNFPGTDGVLGSNLDQSSWLGTLTQSPSTRCLALDIGPGRGNTLSPGTTEDCESEANGQSVVWTDVVPGQQDWKIMSDNKGTLWFDTGTAAMWIDSRDFDAYCAQTLANGHYVRDYLLELSTGSGPLWAVPCGADYLPPWEVEIGGVTFAVPMANLVGPPLAAGQYPGWCEASIVRLENSGDPWTLIGLRFMEQFLVLFDATPGQSRIGLAQR